MSRRPHITRVPDGMDWTVQVVWQPRWDALARRIGGWRRDKASGRPDFSGADLPSSTGPDDCGHGGGHGGGSGWGDWFSLDALGDDLLVALAAFVAMVVFGVLFWWLLLPLLLVLVDGLVLLILLVAGTAARVALGRPWTLLATPRYGPGVEAHVKGWRAARRAQALMRERIQSGLTPWDDSLKQVTGVELS